MPPFSKCLSWSLTLSTLLAAGASRADEAVRLRCRTTVEDRSGSLESLGRCRGQKGSWACYQDVQKVCRDLSTGAEKTRQKWVRWTGLCTTSLSRCWNLSTSYPPGVVEQDGDETITLH